MPATRGRQTPYQAPSLPQTGTEARILRRPASDRLRRVSSILRFGIGSCAGFSSANASLNDHSFATGDLIEVKFRLFGDNIDRDQTGPGTGRSATGRANRQERPCFHGDVLSFCELTRYSRRSTRAGRLNVETNARTQWPTALTPNVLPVPTDVIVIGESSWMSRATKARRQACRLDVNQGQTGPSDCLAEIARYRRGRADRTPPQ